MAPEDARSMPIPDFERTAIAVAAKLGIVSDSPIVVALHALRQGSLQIGWQ